MNRAYQLHLEQIEAHETSYPSPLVTNNAYRALVTAQNYNSARAAARDIVFSCRYNNDILDPKEVIAGLLLEYTLYTLASILSCDFDSNLLDLYIEDLLSSFVLSPTRLRTQDLLPGPEQLANPQISSSFSLPPYNEDTTYIPFP
ncbi:hypothetical protein F8M41_007515 [Gigaspora margarita]|uniref:Uncharacterized protein n=1 Tax=Gigaspora margarita TaxID=4874 RepID=A0A8H4AW58_GIGMA|nr:hypothetical protein F8M41_007515 [Gigaspora margarita]